MGLLSFIGCSILVGFKCRNCRLLGCDRGMQSFACDDDLGGLHTSTKERQSVLIRSLLQRSAELL